MMWGLLSPTSIIAYAVCRQQCIIFRFRGASDERGRARGSSQGGGGAMTRCLALALPVLVNERRSVLSPIDLE